MFAFVGAAGSVIMFVCVGLLFVIMASYFVALAARAYLVTAQGTAAGLNEVPWPDEPVYDWLMQSAYVLGLLLLWIMPAGFLARGLASVWLTEDAPLRFTVLMGLAAWLLFPPGILAVQTPGAVVRLMANFPSLLLFYALTAGIFAACLGLFYVGLFTPGWWVVPLAAVLGSAGVLVHARLLGRLGWLIARDGPGPAAKAEGPKKKKRKRVRAEVSDPWAEDEPPEQEVPPSVPVYAAREIEPEEPKKRRPSYEEPPPDPYEMADLPPPALERQQPAQEDLRKAEIQREIDFLDRSGDPPPASPFFSGVWEYPFYEASRKALAWMSVWSVVVLFVARYLVTLWPF